MGMLAENVIARLKDIVGESKVKLDTDSLETFGKDWTKVFPPNASAIVFPTTTDQVRDIVLLANQEGFALVPSGGRTGLSGGAVATNQEVVVAFDYMNEVSAFNKIDRTVHIGAGVITQQLQEFAEEQGLFYPVDFASAGSSQLGGNIGTNAGGIKVIRYGMTRDWVAGLTVVTGKGDVLQLNKDLVKNNTGYDLRHLFVGAEGTLGFVTEATMQLTRPPKDLTVLVLGVPEFSAMMNVLHAFQQDIDLTAFEFFSDKALAKVLGRGELQAPFETEAPYYALIEFESEHEATMELAMKVFEDTMEQGWVLDGAMSQSQQQAANLWRLREDISETIAEWTPYKNDISVKVSDVPEFLNEVDNLVGEHYPDFEIIWFGHIGDGNLHLNILKPESMEKQEFFDKCGKVSTYVFDIVQKYHGSVSAEHGVGLLKKPYLQYTRSEAEIGYMKAMKTVFDPNNVINPGKVIDI